MLGVADSHPLAGRAQVTLDDIVDLRFPGFHPSSSGGWFSSWFFDDFRSAPAATTTDDAATPFEMAIVVQEGRAIAPAAESFARAFPVDGIRWLPIMDAPPATLALAWYPQNSNPAGRAFVRVGRAVAELAVSPSANFAGSATHTATPADSKDRASTRAAVSSFRSLEPESDWRM